MITCRTYIEKLIPRSILSFFKKALNLLFRSEETDISVNILWSLLVNSYPHACYNKTNILFPKYKYKDRKT